MKNKIDPRHQARRLALKALFEWSFLSRDPGEILNENLNRLQEEGNLETTPDKKLAESLVKGVTDNRQEIDEVIAKCAPEWPISQVAKIDLTILRIAIFEIVFSKITPLKVAIDEAVEVAKEFGGEQSGGFVNGVLGTIVDKLGNV